jgi:hypothetical protein
MKKFVYFVSVLFVLPVIYGCTVEPEKIYFNDGNWTEQQRSIFGTWKYTSGLIEETLLFEPDGTVEYKNVRGYNVTYYNFCYTISGNNVSIFNCGNPTLVQVSFQYDGGNSFKLGFNMLISSGNFIRQ